MAKRFVASGGATRSAARCDSYDTVLRLEIWSGTTDCYAFHPNAKFDSGESVWSIDEKILDEIPGTNRSMTNHNTQEPLPLDEAAVEQPPSKGASSKRSVKSAAGSGKPSSLDTGAKALNSARLAVAALAKARDTGAAELLALHEKAIAGLRESKSGQLLSFLEDEAHRLEQQRDSALRTRREDLLRSAKKHGWTAKRLTKSDVVGCFRIKYKAARATVHLGSERLVAFDEADGTQLFARIERAKAGLDDFPFERNGFFRSLKEAMALAKAQGQARDGKVPIRRLYPLVVLVRQSQDERFVKRPEQKSFSNYPMAQFVYDLARFGKDGWIMQDERLSTQTPNMASIQRGATVMLPPLDGRGNSQQLGMVWIQRVSV